MAQVPPPALRVLFVEDSPDDVELIARELGRHGFQTESRAVETRERLPRRARNEGTWDVILSDHSMKGFSSTEALRLLREHDPTFRSSSSPGTIGEDSAVDAMRAGAHDYVLKHNLRRLGPAVERELREAANRADAAQHAGRAAGVRAAAAACAAHGVGRPARRRHRPRLQQPADGDPGLQRIPDRASCRRTRPPTAMPSEIRTAAQRATAADQAAAGLQPPAGARAPGRRSGRRRRTRCSR